MTLFFCCTDKCDVLKNDQHHCCTPKGGLYWATIVADSVRYNSTTTVNGTIRRLSVQKNKPLFPEKSMFLLVFSGNVLIFCIV